jgi:hypothetical protein
MGNMTEKYLLKIGAVTYLLGLILVFVTESLHPHRQPPSDSQLAFSEYAHNVNWSEIHVAQFFAILLLLLGFISLYKYLRSDDGLTAAFAWLGVLCATVTIGIFALLQAIDGFTLRFVIDRWMHAATPEKISAFRIAEAIRWIEIAFNGYFRIMLGVVLLLYGLSLSFTKLFPKWLGWLAIIAGIGSVMHGLQIGKLGFSPYVGPWGIISLLLQVVWVLIMVVLMWRKSTTIKSSKNK